MTDANDAAIVWHAALVAVIEEWQRATGCQSPDAARNSVDSLVQQLELTELQKSRLLKRVQALEQRGARMSDNDAVRPLGIERLAMRLGDLELRTCDESLTNKGTHCRAEIVKWEGTACFTVAAWDRHTEGFELRFAGSRPFIYADPMAFWQLAKVGDNHLREHFKPTREA